MKPCTKAYYSYHIGEICSHGRKQSKEFKTLCTKYLLIGYFKEAVFSNWQEHYGMINWNIRFIHNNKYFELMSNCKSKTRILFPLNVIGTYTHSLQAFKWGWSELDKSNYFLSKSTILKLTGNLKEFTASCYH
eukprot:310088_1